jgi:hypothetical protein
MPQEIWEPEITSKTSFRRSGSGIVFLQGVSSYFGAEPQTGTDLPDPARICPLPSTSMAKTHPWMKLSRDELTFLRHWMFDETHFQDGPGAANRLQLAHGRHLPNLPSLSRPHSPIPRSRKSPARDPLPMKPMPLQINGAIRGAKGDGAVDRQVAVHKPDDTPIDGVNRQIAA